jgi:hypothetical protein
MVTANAIAIATPDSNQSSLTDGWSRLASSVAGGIEYRRGDASQSR